MMQMMSTRQAAKLASKTHYYGADCDKHGHVMRYVSNGMCVKCQREIKAEHRVESGYQAYTAPYHAGRSARAKGRKKKAPAILNDENVYWWLAGWNDRDMEMQVTA